jgi:MAP/microtubule affinity-regulating kinase
MKKLSSSKSRKNIEKSKKEPKKKRKESSCIDNKASLVKESLEKINKSEKKDLESEKIAPKVKSEAKPEDKIQNETDNTNKTDLTTCIPNYNSVKRALQIKIMKSSLLGKCPETTKNFYEIQHELGSGSYAKVKLGVSILSGTQVALKIYGKNKKTSESSIKRIYAEMKILRRMSHPNIVNFIEIFEQPKKIYTVMEYVEGSDLLKILINKGHFKEKRFRVILQQIVEGLEYIHSHKILHRDIKLDNILLSKNGNIKICDFGISRKMKPGKMINEHIGTPAYLAPEIILEKGYSGFSADVWSLGVMTFMAVTGKVPFKGNNIKELQHSILNSKIVFPSSVSLSSELKKVIRGMLKKDPKTRIGLKEVSRILQFPAVISPANKVNFMNEEIITQIKTFGFQDSMIRKSLRNDYINHITALYKILKFKLN